MIDLNILIKMYERTGSLMLLYTLDSLGSEVYDAFVDDTIDRNSKVK